MASFLTHFLPYLHSTRNFNTCPPLYRVSFSSLSNQSSSEQYAFYITHIRRGLLKVVCLTVSSLVKQNILSSSTIAGKVYATSYAPKQSNFTYIRNELKNSPMWVICAASEAQILSIYLKNTALTSKKNNASPLRRSTDLFCLKKQYYLWTKYNY